MSKEEVIDNDTGEIVELDKFGGGVGAVVAAEINQQVATAKRFPRRRDKEISDEIMSRAGLDEGFAKECMYSVKRGDEMAVGPSIRFAELARASYGNIRVAARFLRIDDDNPDRAAVLVEAIALDLQNNQSESVGLRRSIMTSGSGGRKPRIYSADMINMTVNAAQSIVRRNAILAVVPKPIWLPGYHRAVHIITGDGKTLVARREEILAAFERINITRPEVFAALGVKSIEDITVGHLPALIGMANAIKDGETPDAVLGRARAEAGPAETIKDPLKDAVHDQRNGNGAQAKSEPKKEPEPEQRQAEPERRREDPISSGPQRVASPAQAASPETAKDAAPAGKDAPAQARGASDAGSNGIPEFQSDEALISWVHDFLDTAKSAAVITDMWGKIRPQKNALLDQEQIDGLTADKDAKLRALKK